MEVTGSNPVTPTKKKNEMNQNKHICNLEYCKKHSKCIFHNAISSLKASAYEVSLGSEKHSDIIVCYQKEDIGLEPKRVPEVKPEAVIKRVEDSDSSWAVHLALDKIKKENIGHPHCENPSCNALADLKYNDKLYLCFKHLDLLRSYKSNHELARYFSHRHQLVKLLKSIQELEAPSKEKTVVVRCSNIYCGTTRKMTKHHLIPKSERKAFGLKSIPKIPLCDDCHKRVHKLKTNTVLAYHYNTKAKVIELLSDDIPFRVSRMMTAWEGLTVAPKREMTIVALNSVPSRMVAVAG